MRTFQGLFFLIVGIGLVAIAWRSLSTGWLPFGSRGFGKRLEFRRDEQPLLYWFAFVFFVAGGVGLVIFAAWVLAGRAEPLPLR